jgi:hypothetical protein
MRTTLVGFAMLLASGSASAQLSLQIGLPHASIGINVPVYPELVPVPGYPVYYAPAMDANFFFYDGAYWVYRDDRWFVSSWYNGPWTYVDPYHVPLFVLRVPVGYYRNPPPYFHGWRRNEPPRWGQYWGHDWDEHRHGWDHWDRRAAPARAPLPRYQRQYAGDRYPDGEARQRELASAHYRYAPHDPDVRQHYVERGHDYRDEHERGGGDWQDRGSDPGGWDERGGDHGRGHGHGR